MNCVNEKIRNSVDLNYDDSVDFTYASTTRYKNYTSSNTDSILDVNNYNSCDVQEDKNTTKARQLDGSNVHLNIKSQSSY